MRSMRRSAVAFVVALLIGLLSALPASAATTTTTVSTLDGVEVSPGIVRGDTRIGAAFVGQVSGELPGGFAAFVNYTPASPGPDVVNTVVGGRWSQAVYANGRLLGTLSGRVTGGSATWDAAGDTATLTVALSITFGTGQFRGATGNGTFSGTLTHLAFPPKVNGTLTLAVTK